MAASFILKKVKGRRKSATKAAAAGGSNTINMGIWCFTRLSHAAKFCSPMPVWRYQLNRGRRFCWPRPVPALPTTALASIFSQKQTAKAWVPGYIPCLRGGGRLYNKLRVPKQADHRLATPPCIYLLRRLATVACQCLQKYQRGSWQSSLLSDD